MKCTGCFKELKEEDKAYTTVVGSIEKDSLSNLDDYGFYMSDIESWLSVLCEDCGMSTHKFIAEQLQAKNLQQC